ncbi:carboxy terminal-processing peptidase [Dickeya fangzhongdai]|uniref:carboxy terminal-processing peptidase n=1 Tax=Dickeya fangzhongdai TaxID=1778540 RepID=UPI0026E004BA|nr:carboxy terminal-processing peptidase [Dickeya fangzhongdai]WKV50725.1 carboxy terminal-processing peptidase [Dickeya fangzhongdai]
MPTGNEMVDTGEKFEDNALPWDSIKPASYTVMGDMKPLLPGLLDQHNARIAKDPEFQYIQQDVARYQELKEKRNHVSLNLVKRQKEKNENEATRLQRKNDRHNRKGKPPL